ncbi:hypothetical protein OPU67_08305, partial [Erythrobacter sp. WG]|nr:hypothetical protein [Erythrobacter sp. WG]
MAGVHTIVQPGREGEESYAVPVLASGSLATVRASETRTATARWAAEQTAPTARPAPKRRGPAWPWFLAWLAASALLW